VPRCSRAAFEPELSAPALLYHPRSLPEHDELALPTMLRKEIATTVDDEDDVGTTMKVMQMMAPVMAPRVR